MKAAELRDNKNSIRFSARLVEGQESGKVRSCFLNLPKGAIRKLSSPGERMVEGTINGFPFRRGLEVDAQGAHLLNVNKTMQDAAGAAVGDEVTVEITRLGEESEIRTPLELRKALAAAPQAEALWGTITPMARRDWILWISSAKQEETRRSRIEKACGMLASGKRRVCCFGGLNWLLKDYGTSGGVWQELPKTKNGGR